MNIISAERISNNEFKILLDKPVDVKINEVETKVFTFMLKQYDYIYYISEVYINNEDTSRFESLEYSYDDINILNMDKNKLNSTINNLMKDIYIIPLNYIMINDMYHEIKSMMDFKTLIEELTPDELNTPMSEIKCKFVNTNDDSDGFKHRHLEKIDKRLSYTIKENGTLLNFLSSFKLKPKPPTKTISFKDEYLQQYYFLLKMERKHGNCSRFMCFVLKEYMKNHPEEVEED